MLNLIELIHWASFPLGFYVLAYIFVHADAIALHVDGDRLRVFWLQLGMACQVFCGGLSGIFGLCPRFSARAAGACPGLGAAPPPDSPPESTYPFSCLLLISHSYVRRASSIGIGSTVREPSFSTLPRFPYRKFTTH